jgi:hypothetical protein
VTLFEWIQTLTLLEWIGYIESSSMNISRYLLMICIGVLILIIIVKYQGLKDLKK